MLVVAVCNWIFDWPDWLLWYAIPGAIVAGSVISWVAQDAKKARRRGETARV